MAFFNRNNNNNISIYDFFSYIRLIVFFIFIFYPIQMFAQGFDCQYSPRLPSDSPTIFAGINAESQLFANSGRFQLTEQTVHCCNFSGGWGTGWKIGFAGEMWYRGKYAFQTSLAYVSNSGDFKNRVSAPLSEQELLVTDFIHNSQISYLNLDFGYKQRFADTRFSWGVALTGAVLLESDSKYFERIVSPSNFHFPLNPPSQERIISEGKISDLNSIILAPKFLLAYDFDMGLGKYASFFVSVQLPIMTVTKDDNWRRWHFSTGVNFLKGFY